MTPSELKYHVESTGREAHFFTRKTMKFFGDTMRNYGVRRTTIDTWTEDGVEVWELYRKRPVKHGLTASAYFEVNTFTRRFEKKGGSGA